jgi:phage terminase large subunit-like protein
VGRRLLTRSERNIAWIEKVCAIPEGKRKLVGKPVVLREWQRGELRKIYDNPAGTRQAIISFPRKNGKTALVSFLLLLHLVGPEAVPNSQLYSAAQSRDQAATVFKLASKIVRLSPMLNSVVVIRDTAKELLCPELGTYYAALSADKSTAHGKSPVFACHDELGQVKGPVSDLYDAVETGMGAHDAPLSIIISTQAPTDNDLLSRLIDDALNSRDPQTVISVYSAPMSADPFSEETLRDCNPAWGDFLNADEVLRTMRAAKAMPSAESSYRNLHLNQRVDASNPFVSLERWLACGSDVEPIEGVPVYGGLDLSAVHDLTALVLIGRVDGVWQVHPTFWLPGDGLVEKSARDRVPYDLWRKQGYLLAAPGKSVDYEYVAEYLRGVFDRYNIVKIGFDAWAFAHLRPWLIKAGFTEDVITERFQEFRQGTKSMTPALRDLEAEIVNERLAHGNHPVLSNNAGNAVVRGQNNDRKLDKAKSAGRIDGMVSLAMAFGVAPLHAEAAGAALNRAIRQRAGFA